MQSEVRPDLIKKLGDSPSQTCVKHYVHTYALRTPGPDKGDWVEHCLKYCESIPIAYPGIWPDLRPRGDSRVFATVS